MCIDNFSAVGEGGSWLTPLSLPLDLNFQLSWILVCGCKVVCSCGRELVTFCIEESKNVRVERDLEDDPPHHPSPSNIRSARIVAGKSLLACSWLPSSPGVRDLSYQFQFLLLSAFLTIFATCVFSMVGKPVCYNLLYQQGCLDLFQFPYTEFCPY